MHQSRRLKSKIKPLEELSQIVQELKRQGKQVVFTNGCFDIIHAGHVNLLQQARDSGDVLVVAINSDSSVRTLKGRQRPVNPQQQRSEVVASLESVDYVVVFDELDPLRVIEEIEPQVLVKGGDWALETIVGREVVERAGGKVLSIPLTDWVSTTDIIKRVAEGFTAESETPRPVGK